MYGVCLNSWQTYGCEWSVGYLWRWMNWIVRLDVIVLALMLVCVVVVVTRIFYRYHLARPAGDTDSATRGRLAAVLSIELGGLKAIASTAPYLGLAGTCVGILSAYRFRGSVAMEENTFLLMMATRMAAPLLQPLREYSWLFRRHVPITIFAGAETCLRANCIITPSRK